MEEESDLLSYWEKKAFEALYAEAVDLVERELLKVEEVTLPKKIYTKREADILSARIIPLVQGGKIDSRCRAADALLDYALTRFGSQSPIGDLRKQVEAYKNARDL